MDDKYANVPPELRTEAERVYQRIRDAFPHSTVAVPGGEALAAWRQLRLEGEAWPVVIGSDDEFDRVAEQFSIDDPALWRGAAPPPLPSRAPAEILAAAGGLRFPEDQWEGAYAPEDLIAPVGEWPDDQGAIVGEQIVVAYDVLTREPHETVHIALLPTRSGWEAPAYLRWGGWNACSLPEFHVAALNSLHRRFGAELVCMSGDIIELAVERRPSTRGEALALARELYAYCPDNVDQGTGTLATYAAVLMQSSIWTFWWD